MYRPHKKTEHHTEEKISQKDCFAENAKNWFWLIIVIFVAAFVYAIVTSFAQKNDYSSASQNLPQGAQLQNVALMRCPYCPGLLDARRRCGVRQCLLYSPDWQRLPNKQEHFCKTPPNKGIGARSSCLTGPRKRRNSVCIYRG